MIDASTIAVPLTLGASIIGTAIITTWSIRGQLENIRSEIRGIKEDMASAYTQAAASEHALRLAIENPGMRVPDPRNHDRIICVRAAEVHS